MQNLLMQDPLYVKSLKEIAKLKLITKIDYSWKYL